MKNQCIGFFILGVLFITGCASSHYQMGRRSLDHEQYDEAIIAFEKALEEDPENMAIERDLGVAYFSKTQFGDAMPHLLKSFIANPKDGRTLFYLGATYELIGDYRHAIDIYRRYADVSPSSPIRSSIEGRLTNLMRKQMAEEAKNILAQEKTLDIGSVSDSTVAILYFENIGKNDDLDPIQKGLTEMLITDLSKVKSHQIVERLRMQKMIEEMGLGQTGLVDDKTAPRMGRLLGASKVLKGTFLELSKNRLRIDSGILETKTNRLKQAKRVQESMDQFFRMEKTLAFEIVDKLGITLSQAEIDAIEEMPTQNMLAFMAYCKGLDYEDKGMLDQASDAYREAIQIDPNFTKASQQLNQTETMKAGEVEITQLETQLESESSEPDAGQSIVTEKPEAKEPDVAAETDNQTEAPVAAMPEPVSVSLDVQLVDQMIHTGNMMDQGFLPGVESREPAQEEGQTSYGSEIQFEIRVPLPDVQH